MARIRSIRSIPAQPLFWFGFQCAIVTGFLSGTGRLEPERVPDTASYEQFSFDTVEEVMAAPRTVGYPLYLRLTRRFGKDQRVAPLGHLLVHLAAVLAFWRALIAVGWPSGAAMLLASTLFYANILIRYVQTLAPDSLACSLAIGAVASLLFVVADRHRWSNWLWLGGTCLATYHLRPAYVFLALLIPLLGCGLHWILSRVTSGRVLGEFFLKLLGLTLLPLLLWCGLRWATVGDFGPVAFGANNLAGVVSGFIDTEQLESFDADIRPLATRIANARQELADETAMSAKPFPASASLSYLEIEQQFDSATWLIAVPAARDTVGGAWPAMNKALMEYSLAVIQMRPLHFAVWLVKAAVRGIYMVVSEIVMNPVYLLLLVILFIVRIRNVVGIKISRYRISRVLPDSCYWRTNALLLLAIVFAGSKIGFIILTTPPLGRFMDVAGVFLPLLLAQALAYEIGLDSGTLTLRRGRRS